MLRLQFWTRFGTPTDKYESGTEEVEELLALNKQVFIYFVDEPVNPSNVDMKQYKKVCEFKEVRLKYIALIRMRNMKEIFKKNNVLLVPLIILVIVVSYFFYTLSPVGELDDYMCAKNQLFVVESEDSAEDILENLFNEGYIKNKYTANLYAALVDNTNVEAGVYVINKNYSVSDFLELFSDNSNAFIGDTIILVTEGDRLKDIALIIAAETTLNYAELLAYWNNEDVIRNYMNEFPFLTEEILQEDSEYYLEGYFLANMYAINKNASLDEVTRSLLSGAMTKYSSSEQEILKSKYSIHEIFTLSSMVQSKSSTLEDMFRVSRVIENRLNVGMNLQLDATSCYILNIGKEENWETCEVSLTFNSPYNTHFYPSLTPGPIMSFCEEAIDAVLGPQEHASLDY